MKKEELIYDWNTAREKFIPAQAVELDDETLRDGLQSPSVTQPPLKNKLKMLELMESLGIDTADIGLPGAGEHVKKDVLEMASFIARQGFQLKPNCAARTVVSDIEPIADISQKTGQPIETYIFLGSSPLRLYAEDWDLNSMLKFIESATHFAVQHHLPVSFVTEDTTRSRPETIQKLYQTAIEHGAARLCLCDTVGHVTPPGVRALVQFVRSEVIPQGKEDQIKVDWHGHRDRGLDIINTLAAIEAGVDRVHGTAIGIGERVGNTPMDLLLVNLTLLGWIQKKSLARLGEYCELASLMTQTPIPPNYPVFGQNAFETGTGVHAAAIIKAYKKGDYDLADRVYSGVPASWFGLTQKIRIGPMSGKSNVLWWLEQHKIEAAEEEVQKIFNAAKASDHLLSDEEISSHISGKQKRTTVHPL